MGESIDDLTVCVFSLEGTFWKKGSDLSWKCVSAQKTFQEAELKVILSQVRKLGQRKGSEFAEATQRVRGGTEAGI